MLVWQNNVVCCNQRWILGPLHNPNNPEMITAGYQQSMVYGKSGIGEFRESQSWDTLEHMARLQMELTRRKNV